MKGGTNRRGMIGRAAISLAALMGMGFGTPGMSMNNSQGQSNVRSVRTDAINEVEKLNPRTVSRSKIHGAGDANPFKIGRTPPKNQQQYREMLRRNPHFAHSKKSKLKQRSRRKRK